MSNLEGIVRFFQSGGVFMYPLMFILALGTAIVVERVMILMRSRVDAVALWRKLSSNLDSKKFDEALKACSGPHFNKPLHHVMKTGIQGMQMARSREEIQGMTDEAVMEVMPRLEARLHYLPNLANVATLVGLLGTIMGLIDAFTAVGAADPAQKAALLAKGISLAMNTTAFGLVVAIPLMLIYTFLQAWTNRSIDRLDEYALKLLNFSGASVRVEGGGSKPSLETSENVVESDARGKWRVTPGASTEGMGHAQ